MKFQIEIIKDENLDFTKVRYYTLKFIDEEKTEYQKFIDEYKEEYLYCINFLKLWIAQIGEKFGADDQYFRPEDNASALPPPTKTIRKLDYSLDKKNLSLRLYCIVLSMDVVILVSGGIKESDAARDSPTCFEKLMFAQSISSQFHFSKKRGEWNLKGKDIKTEKNFRLTYQKK
ncbi:hypothetical protein [Aureibaculum luteum]|uniref:hypothetical protein n=1 Tax=Aureibaculum luteum TaxID=1548456 RepID=UPI000E4B2B1B|nr:hypothetical protein [Aureibaculum luteum]